MRRAGILALCLLPALAGAAAPLRGVNLSGAELAADKLPGRAETDYFYPNDAEIARWAGMGMTVLRLPVLWERLQPVLGGTLDAPELARLRAVLADASRRGVSTIIDLHNYGAYRGARIGQGSVTARDFADFWARMAAIARGERVAFGLMNEPNGIAAPAWAGDEQQAIDAIRATGAANLILVSGTGWDGAHNFVSGDGYGVPNATALAGLRDPAGNLAFDMHQYFDADFSGTHGECASPAQAVRLLAPATAWLRAQRKRGFLGEFGATRTPGCLATLAAILQTINGAPDAWIGWTYWAAGRWWGNYMFSVEPSAGVSPPQLDVLARYLHPASP